MLVPQGNVLMVGDYKMDTGLNCKELPTPVQAYRYQITTNRATCI